jgi:hypothetical protein
MSVQKLLLMLAGSVIIAAVVTYQVRSRRPVVSTTAPQNPVAAPSPVSPPMTAQTPPTSPMPPQPNMTSVKTSIPGEGWGRNPFLTVDEIAKLNRPPEEITIAPPEPPPPPALPVYEVTAIIKNEKGAWAVMTPNSRVVRVGDRLGTETVKQIKEEAVVLEHDGKTREVALKPAGLEVQPAPKGEQQP